MPRGYLFPSSKTPWMLSCQATSLASIDVVLLLASHVRNGCSVERFSPSSLASYIGDQSLCSFQGRERKREEMYPSRSLRAQSPMNHGVEKEKSKSETMMMIGGGGGGGELESSLLELIHDHHITSLTIQEQTDKAKKDALRIGMRVSDLLVDTVNGGVQESFVNEKRIEVEIRALTSTVIRYTRQTDQWLAASHAINSVLKEIGDFENWMRTMDYDCKIINAAIRNIYKP